METRPPPRFRAVIPGRAHGHLGAAGELPVRRIVPCQRRLALRDVRSYVPIIRVIAARDFKAKYKQSVLGPVWLFAQPLALLGALVFAFHGVSHSRTGGIPYAV